MNRGIGSLVGVSGRRASVTYEYGRDSQGKPVGVVTIREGELDAELLSDQLSLVTSDGSAFAIRIDDHDSSQAAFVGV